MESDIAKLAQANTDLGLLAVDLLLALGELRELVTAENEVTAKVDRLLAAPRPKLPELVTKEQIAELRVNATTDLYCGMFLPTRTRARWTLAALGELEARRGR